MFKKDFIWGTATAAYQIEGGCADGGRTPSTWDIFSHQKGKTREGANGDVACDSYHRWREDVELMKGLGVNAYRFSISWNRILPEGTGKINEDGIDYYRRLAEELLKNGITPYATLFHWDYPYCLYRRGGWMNPDSSKWFGEYAAAVGKRLGDIIKHFIPFNEPQCFIGLGHQSGTHAPGLRLDEPDLSHCIHNVLLSNGRAIQALRAEVDGAVCGFANCGGAAMPKTNSEADIKAACDWMFGGCGMWDDRLWMDPMYLGIYPETLVRTLGEPSIEDMRIISERPDFVGINIYQSDEIAAGPDGRPYNAGHCQGHTRTSMDWAVTPDCLYWAAKFLYERYKLPIIVTENGMSNNDVITPDGKCHDPQRVEYLRGHLSGLKRAAAEGVDVAGYFQWSLLDNFEWADGYNQRFGLVYVDYATCGRTPKDSAEFFASVVKSNGEIL